MRPPVDSGPIAYMMTSMKPWKCETVDSSLLLLPFFPKETEVTIKFLIKEIPHDLLYYAINIPYFWYLQNSFVHENHIAVVSLPLDMNIVGPISSQHESFHHRQHDIKTTPTYALCQHQRMAWYQNDTNFCHRFLSTMSRHKSTVGRHWLVGREGLSRLHLDHERHLRSV